ncbi:MAG: tol-pal system protein YbgF [Desulfosudaceae bacterium]
MRKFAGIITAVGLLLVTGGLLNGCQFFQVAERDDDPLLKLEAEVYNLQAELDEARQKSRDREAGLREEYASLKSEFVELRSEVQSLRGGLEETSYLFNNHIKDFERDRDKQAKRISWLEEELVSRIDRVEEYLDQEKSNSTDETADSDDEKETLIASEESFYTTSRQLFEAGNYEAARRSFTKLMQTYPESEMCDNAQFWIGESYYREQWYKKAILEYQEVLDNYPDGNKVPAALLKQGLAFINIDDQTNARLVLKKLLKNYPESNEAGIAQKKLEELESDGG